MRWAAFAICLGCVAAPAVAQDDDAGFLEGLIEDALSGDDRDVVIRGFSGALAGQSTIESLTISDADGVWLEVTDVELDWSRLALLRRRLEVNTLSVGSIDYSRAPLPAQEATSPEASSEPFAFPELPVDINIGQVTISEIDIGQDAFGYAFRARAEGSARLGGGEGDVKLTLERTDGPLGRFDLAGNFVADTSVLGISLTAEEAAGGIVATLAGLPGAPSILLTIDGQSPISNYVANISLQTDGEPRLTGQVETALNGPADEVPRTFAARLAGDVTPLFAPEYQTFFGPSVLLALRGESQPSGRLVLDAFALEAQSISLTGQVALAPGFLPESIDVTGSISDTAGEPVLLPLSGEPTTVGRVDLSVGFDAQSGDAWTARFAVEDFARQGATAEALVIDGGGTIRGIEEDVARAVTASLDLSAREVNLGDETLDSLIAQDVVGSLELNWSEGAPIVVDALSIDGGLYDLNATATINDPGPNLNATFQASANANDIAAFAGLVGRDISGEVSVEADGSVTPVNGRFDVTASVRSNDLVLDQEQADALIAGSASVDLRARRDAEGITIDRAQIETPHASADVSGKIASSGSALTGEAEVDDVARVLVDVSGPASVSLDASQGEEGWVFDIDGSGAGVALNAKGTVRDVLSAPAGQADLDLTVADLEPFSPLAGRDLDGAIALTGTASGDLGQRDVTVDLDGTLTDIVVGIARVDALLAGRTSLSVKADVTADAFLLETLTVRNTALDLSGSGRLDGALATASGEVNLTANLRDLALIDPRAEGAANLSARLEAENGTWTYDLDATAPELSVSSDGTITDLTETARVEGTLTADARDLSRFAPLAGIPLAGSVNASGSFSGTQDLAELAVDLAASGDSLSIGQGDVDQLLAGPFSIALDASRQDGAIEITTANLDFAQVDLTASGQVSQTSGDISFKADLANLGLFLPNVPGAATVEGQVSRDGSDRLTVRANGTGPDGITLALNGGLAADFSTVDLNATGAAPLGLANRFIAPITGTGTIGFDVAVNGPPALSSVSGTLNVGNGTVVIPQVPMVLEGLTAEVALGGSQANLNVRTALRDGGRISISGPIDLAAPFNGAIEVRLDGATLTDSSLYRTVLTGDITMNGPLTGGANIAGTINVGETLIRLDAAGGGVAGLPTVDHRGLPPAVRQTLERAGLITEEGAEVASEPGVAYPLSVRINAPLVELRGLGVNANLGGSLDVGGTTTNVVPVGQIGLIRGTLDLFGRRLILTEADVTLAGSLDPFVNIVATNDRRSSDDAEAFAIIRGPISDPEITFESNPQLPEDEVLARLLFGTSIENISPLQAAQIAATVSGSGNILGGVQQGLGLDDLSLTTDDSGATALTAGTYLTDTIYADVTSRSDGETEFRLNLDLTDSITVTGKSDNTGESGVGIFFKRDY